MIRIALLLAYCLIVSAAPASAGDYLYGVVKKVTDGDSLVAVVDGSDVEIRLYGIDAPEYGQSYGNSAKNYATGLVRGKDVRILPFYKDSYGRIVALVEVDNFVLNEEMVKNGYAWVYQKYCSQGFCEDWEALEKSAREHHRGLWHSAQPLAPWVYKRTVK